MDCKECKHTCCDDLSIKLEPGTKNLIDPLKCKPGDWFFTHGITLVKKRNGLWKCRAFDSKTKLCRIWKYRPPLCRGFFCPDVKKKERKLPVNYYKLKEKYSLMFIPHGGG